MFDVFCLGVALAVGQAGPQPIPPTAAGKATFGQEIPGRIPAALPTVGVPGIPVMQKKDAPDAPDEAKKDDEKKDDEKKPEEKGHLMKLLEGTPHGCWMEANRISISGFTEVSYTHSNRGRINWPMLFQTPTNEFLLNQNWLTVEKTVDTESKCPTWGFRVDAIVPGSDARFVRQRNLFDGQTGRNQYDVYQFYGEYYDPNIAKGLDVKVGRMAVPYMAEVTPAVTNPLFSHSYAYYYNPFTHTGIWATLTLDDSWSVGLIASLGNDVFFGPSVSGMYVGILQWTSTDKNDTALLCVGLSTGRFNVEQNFGNQNHVDLVYTHKFSDQFRYTLDTGFGWEKDIPNIAETTWSWMVNYLTYDFSDQVSGTTRFETFHDAEGFKTGTEGTYLAGTAGLTFKPMNSVLFRPEVRYDYNTERKPFNGHHGLCTLAADFIVKW